LGTTGGTAEPTLWETFGRPGLGAWEKIGLDFLLFHDLRRSGIREMVRSGYSEQTAMEISGHRTNETFQRYNIQDLEDQMRAAELVGTWLSLVEHRVRDAGVAGSNPVVPTSKINS
jgi:integrase